MRVIIAGSRTGVSMEDVYEAIDRANFPISIVISGFAEGVDRMGEKWATENGIPLVRYYAHWSEHGNRAGILRNIEMAKNADALIAVWNGESKGTAHMIAHAQSKGLKVFVHSVSKECVH